MVFYIPHQITEVKHTPKKITYTFPKREQKGKLIDSKMSIEKVCAHFEAWFLKNWNPLSQSIVSFNCSPKTKKSVSENPSKSSIVPPKLRNLWKFPQNRHPFFWSKNYQFLSDQLSKDPRFRRPIPQQSTCDRSPWRRRKFPRAAFRRELVNLFEAGSWCVAEGML